MKKKWTFPKLERPAVFIGSPGDVDYLRELAKREFEALRAATPSIAETRLYLWEDEAFERAFDHHKPYQAGIPLTSDPHCLAVIFLFGERIGSELPADFPEEPFAASPALDPGGRYRLLRARREVAEDEHADGTFPLTGTVFEYLVAEAAVKPLLLLFKGDESLELDEDVLDQNWGMNLLYEEEAGKKRRSEFNRWVERDAIPQRLWLRHFHRYVTRGRTHPAAIVSSDEQARREIRDFLVRVLELSPRQAHPFKRLAAYEVEDHGVFFGRTGPSEYIAAEIRRRTRSGRDDQRPFFAIFGASGSGKSSLMRAGVVARLQLQTTLGNWVGHVARPGELTTADGDDPLVPLVARCLEAIEGSASAKARKAGERGGLTDILPERRPEKALEWLIAALDERRESERRGRWRLILGLDQFEELLEELGDAQEAAKWEGLISFLDLATRGGRIAVAFTLPTFRLDQLRRHPLLETLSLAGDQKKVGFPTEAIEEIIDRSFGQVDLRLAPSLRAKLLEAIQELTDSARGADLGAVLPLLSLAMSRIYERWKQSTEVEAAGERARDEEADAEEADAGEADAEAGEKARGEEATADDQEMDVRREFRETSEEKRPEADDGRRLDVESYADLAELGTIIDQECENAFEEAKTEAGNLFNDEAALSELLRPLIRFSPNQPDNFVLLDTAPSRDPVLKALTAALRRHRLLVETRVERLRLVHESILRHWDRAAEWVTKERRRLEYVSGIGPRIRRFKDDGCSLEAIERLGADDIEGAAEVLYAWSTTLAPIFADHEVDEKHADLRAFLLAVLRYQDSPRETIDDLEKVPTHFHAAVAAGDEDLVEHYLSQDGSLVHLTREKDGRTALFEACFFDRREILERLLEAGADPNLAEAEGWYPLHAAATRGHWRAAEILLGKVDDVDARGGPTAVTALHTAVAGGQERVAKVLLEHGADVEAADKRGSRPLHMAAQGGFQASTRQLLRRGAEIDAPNRDLWTPLHTAAVAGHEDVVRVLLEHEAQIDPSLRSGWTPLHLCAQEGHTEIARLLIRRGASPEVSLDDDWNPLHIAAHHGRADVARLFIEEKVAIDAPAGYRPAADQRRKGKTAPEPGWTPLHIAAHRGHLSVARALVDGGANLGARNGQEKTPLHTAVESAHRPIVQLLAAESGDLIDARDQRRQTPFHLALAKGDFALSRLLLDAGADVDAPRGDGRTSLEASVLAGDRERVELLLAWGARTANDRDDQRSALHLAARRGRDEIAALLLDGGAELEASDRDGRAPLHLAALEGQTETVRLLLDRGARIEARDERGLAPLHLAALRGHEATAERLLAEGAEADAVDEHSWTPLHVASQAGQAGIVGLLAARGLDLEAVSSRPAMTSLQAATEVGQTETVFLLLAAGASIEASTADRAKPLLLAVKNAHFELATQLLAAGARAGIVDVDGETTLPEVLQRVWAERQPPDPADATALLELIERLVAAGVPGSSLPSLPAAAQLVPAARLAKTISDRHGFHAISEYPWQPLEEELREELIDRISPVDGVLRLSTSSTRFDICSPPWYEEYRLVRVVEPNWVRENLAVYYLMSGDRNLFRLNGTSPPIHEVNAKAPVLLNEENVLDYLRFFCFFVRGEEGPFFIVDRLDDPMLPQHPRVRPVLEGAAVEPSLEGLTEKGHFRCGALVYYSNAMFIASFEVQPTGMIEMLDDEPIAADLAAKVDAPLTA